jgi:hypothetical protein
LFVEFNRRMNGFARLAGLQALLLGSLTSLAVPVPRLPISSGQVLAALRTDKITAEAEGGRVEFLSVVTSSVAKPRLRVVELAKLTPESLRMRLQCNTNRECLPFLAILHVASQAERDQILALWHQRSPQSRDAHMTARLSPAPNIVRAGSAVKLLIDGKNMRITVPVVCLQSGRQGQTIRVASSDRKRVYQAQVISQEFVRNTL